MPDIRLIVCPIDFSAISVRAYRHVLSLAEHYQARSVALHIVEGWRHLSADYGASAAVLNEFYTTLGEIGWHRLLEFAKNHHA